MKESILFKMFGGSLIALASFLWGGLDNYMTTLITFIIVDFLTGTIYAATTQTVSFWKSFNGFSKKIAVLLMVAVAVRVDIMMGAHGSIRVLAIYGYIGSELYSIIENFIKLKVPVPYQLAKYFKVYIEGAGNNEK